MHFKTDKLNAKRKLARNEPHKWSNGPVSVSYISPFSWVPSFSLWLYFVAVLLTQCPNPFDVCVHQQQSMKWVYSISFQPGTFGIVRPLKSLFSFILSARDGRRLCACIIIISLFPFLLDRAHNSIGWKKSNLPFEWNYIWLYIVCMCEEVGNHVLMFIAAWRLQK